MQTLTVALLGAVLLTTGACQKKSAEQHTTDVDSALVKQDTLTPADTPLLSPDNFLIIPSEQVGTIRANSTEASLVDLLGKENVTLHDTIYIGEGATEPGTTLFKGTPDEVQIIWADKKAFARPEAVIIRPASDRPGTAGNETQWKTVDNLSIGTSLKEVEKINGKPFLLYGFSWDYGGTVSNWQGGNLQAKDGKTYLSVVFGYGELSAEQEKLSEQVMGDSEFLSSKPAMQQINPTVQSITVRFK